MENINNGMDTTSASPATPPVHSYHRLHSPTGEGHCHQATLCTTQTSSSPAAVQHRWSLRTLPASLPSPKKEKKNRTPNSPNMCYYDNFKYACLDWKWGNFRQHCQKEYRTGETCGMKMIFQTIMLAEKCPSCEKIEKKLRRRAKALSDHARWAKDGSKFKASMEKALEEVAQLEREIRILQVEKDRRFAAVGNSRRN